MNKTLWLGLEHQFSDEFSGFARAYGYDNRTKYDAEPSWDYAGVIADTRELSSRNYDVGVKFTKGIYSSQLISSYSHLKDYDFDPKKRTL